MKRTKLDKYSFSTPDAAYKTAPLHAPLLPVEKQWRTVTPKTIWWQRCFKAAAALPHNAGPPSWSKQPEGKSEGLYKGERTKRVNKTFLCFSYFSRYHFARLKHVHACVSTCFLNTGARLQWRCSIQLTNKALFCFLLFCFVMFWSKEKKLLHQLNLGCGVLSIIWPL